MPQFGFDRRRFAAGLLTAAAAPGLAAPGLAWPGAALADQDDVVVHGVYEPPASLAMALALARRMTVPVWLNGAGPFAFIIDTGANQSVVSRELCAQLGLPLETAAPVHGVAGVELAPTVMLRELRADRFVRMNARLSVLPEGPMGAVGVLGLEAMAQKCLTLDYQKERLTIGRSWSSTWLETGEVAAPAIMRNGQLTLVDARLRSGARFTAFIDTGAEKSVGNLALMNLAGFADPTAPVLTTPLMSITGQVIQTRIGLIDGFKIGGFTIANLGVLFADVHTFDLWGLNQRPAMMLGVDVLTRFRKVALDFGRSEVRFTAP